MTGPGPLPLGLDTLPDISDGELFSLEEMFDLDGKKIGSAEILFNNVALNNLRLKRVIRSSVELQLMEEHLRDVQDGSRLAELHRGTYDDPDIERSDGNWDGHRFVVSLFTKLTITRCNLDGIEELLNMGGAWTHLPVADNSEEAQVMSWLMRDASFNMPLTEAPRHRAEAGNLLTEYCEACPNFRYLYLNQLEGEASDIPSDAGWTVSDQDFYQDSFEFGVAHALGFYTISAQNRFNEHHYS